MSRFLSCIILLSVLASCQSKISFTYSSRAAFDPNPETFNVGVDFIETKFSNFSIMDMKPRTVWMTMDQAGEFHVTLEITNFGGTLTREEDGTCNILIDQNQASIDEYSAVGDSPDKAVAQANQDIAAVAEGVNYKSSWAVGPNSVQLNIRRATTELAQAIVSGNCDTLDMSYGLLI